MPTGNEHPRHKEYARNVMRNERAKLEEMARINGYEKWSQMKRAIMQGGALVLAVPVRCTVHNDLGRYDFIMSARDSEAFMLFCEQQGLVAHFEIVKLTENNNEQK